MDTRDIARNIGNQFAASLDSQNTGLVSRALLQRVLQHLNAAFTDENTRRLLGAFRAGSGDVRYRHFLEWLFGVRSVHSDSACVPELQYLGHKYRAVSVHYFADVLIQDEVVKREGLPPDTRVHEIEENVIRRKGAEVTCPRDGRLGAAYVGCVFGEDNVGLAVIMLSYTWGYTLSDIKDGLEQYCKDHSLNPRRIFVLMCCLCVNQHRVKEGGKETFETFAKSFRSCVEDIGKIVALMAPWRKPQYITRVWCDFEMYTAMTLEDRNCDICVTMPQREKLDLFNCLCTGKGMDEMWTALRELDVWKAEASFQEDKDRIFDMIRLGEGFHKVNMAVSKYLQNWMVSTCEAAMHGRIALGNLAPEEEAQLRLSVGSLLRKIGLSSMVRPAERNLVEGLEICKKHGLKDELICGRFFVELGCLKMLHNDQAGAQEDFRTADAIFCARNALETPDGVNMLVEMGNAWRKQKCPGNAVSTLTRARSICDRLGTLDSACGARLLQNIGDTKRRQKDNKAAKEDLKAARQIMEAQKIIETPAGADVLLSLGVLSEKGERVDEDSLYLYEKALRIRELTHTVRELSCWPASVKRSGYARTSTLHVML